MDIRKFGGQTRTLSSAANEPNNDPEATEVSGSGDVLSDSGEGFSLLSSRLLSTDSISVESCLDLSTLTCVGTASLPSDLATPLNDIDKWEIVIRGPPSQVIVIFLGGNTATVIYRLILPGMILNTVSSSQDG